MKISWCDKVKDVTGAGDTFLAVFASYFDADNIVRTLDIANTAAGVSVSKFGTYAVTRQDLMKVRDYFLGTHVKVLLGEIPHETSLPLVWAHSSRQEYPFLFSILVHI